MKIQVLTLIFLLLIHYTSAQKNIPGFMGSSLQEQKKLETNFDRYIKSENLDQWMKKLSARPHHLGSSYQKELCQFISSLFESWGYQVKVDTYYVLFPTPKIRQVEMISPTHYKAVLAEPKLKEDATSGQTSEQLPTYNAYSADGDVEGELVYVNYGVKDDYKELERMGISVNGKIVITRYMGSWRGIKPKLAAEHGAIGCIIYSDPKDDGFYQGDVYPEGPFKSEMGVQRGSVMDMPVYPGDPLTPGLPATKDADRLDRSNAKTLVKIPVLPISWHDAEPLLRNLKGPVCPESWRGALPVTYHAGPGPAKVRMNLKFNWDIKPVYDIIATLKGSKYPDQWILRGNHYDAWVNGAADPVSGTVALMEEARITSELAREGHAPMRTIVYCVWDGEEPGLIGSTEWVEGHADELRKKAVAYINTDGNSRGFLYAGGSHSLNSFMESIAGSVIDPQTGVTVGERLKARQIVNKGKEEYKGFHIEALGSGSDYTPFIQHLGISSLNIAYGGEGNGGEYHSIYDSYDDYTRFKDPGFQYGTALVETTGRAVLRLANADIMPFNVQEMDSTMATYIKELVDLSDDKRKENQEVNYLLEKKMYTLAADPTKKYVPPEKKPEVPYLNFAPVQNAMANLDDRVAEWKKISPDSLSEPQIEAYNNLVYHLEEYLISDQGLPGRPWFKHVLYAPGLYTGYGVKTMPGIREALEEEKFNEAQDQINIMANVIREYSSEVANLIENVKKH